MLGTNVSALALSRRMISAVCSWPTFSLTSFRMVEALRQQQLIPASVIDVGGNIGQFAVAAAKLLKPRVLYSFEPIPAVADSLRRNLASFAFASVNELLLGEREGATPFHINSHNHSSSVLKLGQQHLDAFPDAREVQTIEVPMTTLDRFFSNRELPAPALLKIDVQGYEAHVLRGGTATLPRMRWIVAETSLKPMYQGEPVFLDIVECMKEWGFRFLRPVGWLSDPRNGELLQLDALFERDAN